MKPKLDWFLIGLAGAAALAWIFPDPGARGGFLHPELLNKLGVSLIFFLHGGSLPFSALRAGMLRWRLHLLVQAATFVVFPLLGLCVLWLVGGHLPSELGLGFFYLCALPSTVSSSVALTSAARGNVAAAVFNASLSSLLGIFVTPLWVGLRLESVGQALPLGRVVLDLVLWLLTPLLVGQALRPLIAGTLEKQRAWVGLVDRTTILLLVYASFCDSVKSRVWAESAGLVLFATLGLGLLLFATLMLGTAGACNALGFSAEDRIAAMFCGSKKSLAAGVPMARLMFGSSHRLGVILLPILLYHPLQLAICGWLAGRFSRRPAHAR